MIAETTPRPTDSQLESKRQRFEEESYTNELFRVEFFQKNRDKTAAIDLKRSPPLDQYGQPILEGFEECPILFKMKLTGLWAEKLWIAPQDTVRIIGTFSKHNKFCLTIDEDTQNEQGLLH